ncbi:hypothetical protein [uncultured Desulfovibrio sp.]|uniref:hypothetical protein n=1 Tax=uncultured Desulfovibrio sp. TaxID=167968 RepID=UPI00261C45D2|nr:hypothetical protein [uncultured Desulfovibrio sp.]
MEAKPNCPKRHTGAERFREGKGIVAGIANSNLPEPLPEAVRQMKKALCDGSVPVRHCPAVSCFTPAVFRWTRNFAERVYEKPELGEGIVEPSEMWRFLKSKNKLWI